MFCLCYFFISFHPPLLSFIFSCVRLNFFILLNFFLSLLISSFIFFFFYIFNFKSFPYFYFQPFSFFFLRIYLLIYVPPCLCLIYFIQHSTFIPLFASHYFSLISNYLFPFLLINVFLPILRHFPQFLNF